MGAFNHTSGIGAVSAGALDLNTDTGAPAGSESARPQSRRAPQRDTRGHANGVIAGSDVSYPRCSDPWGQLSHFERDMDIA